MTAATTPESWSANAPISELEQQRPARAPEEGMALCLSGGGYRAMLFHTGTLWRLYDAGLLGQIKRISSVSGGSIIAAHLGLKWARVFRAGAPAGVFADEVVAPIRALAGVTIDVGAVIKGILLPGTINDYLARAYARHLYGDATLQALPDDPHRFVINATNVQSGALWRFSKPYMRDYLVGGVGNPTVSLAHAVAASSAFPPFLSPACLDGSQFQWMPPAGEPLHKPPFTTKIVLTDGGVYDNLGLETAWKRYRTVLVSDAGQKMPPDAKPHTDWLRHASRVRDIEDNQVRSLRTRQLIASFAAGVRKGSYWSIQADIADYRVPGLPCPYAQTQLLAQWPTRLGTVDDLTQDRLINWGYALCDAALRAWLDPGIPAAQAFPYPRSGV